MHSHTHFQSCHLPLTSLRSLPSLTMRPPGPAAATRPLGQLRSWWAQGSTGSFRLEERKASVYSDGWLQNGLCLLWDFIYFHTSLRPLTPVWSQRTGRKILYFHDYWQHSLAGREHRGREHWEALAQDISGLWKDSSLKNWKENDPTSSFRQYTVWSLCRRATLNRIPLYFSFAGVLFGRRGPYLVIYLFYPCITYILNNAYHAIT